MICNKRLKDPIYGYIDIPADYMKNIIDTAPFQRLRRIIQTSYSPLYASSSHNRFIHSLGVYYLGKIASSTLIYEATNKAIHEELDINLDSLGNLFLLACLLHDVGHAPFSHTGEKYFLDNLSTNGKYKLLHDTLCELVGSEEFNLNIPKEDSKSAAPHEVMSAIIGLRQFKSFFRSSEDREFFTRCITGYKYSETSSEKSLRNCFIVLLNSKVIDVDRLDYLIRDAFYTGFSTINIDYERLLTSLTLVKIATDDGSKYELGYYKGAISVIENVVYAHDAERKWIQTHPVILYDTYIIQHIISKLNEKFEGKNIKLFSEKSLGENGQLLDDNFTISLLCDDDIISLMKGMGSDSLSKEYFDRRSRRHPVWKSESEYRAFFLGIVGSGKLLSEIEAALRDTEKYLRQQSADWVINDTIINKVKSEIAAIEEDNTTPRKTVDIQLTTKGRILKLMESLQEYAVSLKMSCDYVILEASQFSSGFNRPDFSDINIVFQSAVSVRKFSEIVTSLSGRDKPRASFFYLYYKQISDVDVKKEELCKTLFKAFI